MRTIERKVGHKYDYSYSVLQLEAGDTLVLKNKRDWNYELENIFIVEKVGEREARIASIRNPDNKYRLKNRCPIFYLQEGRTPVFEVIGSVSSLFFLLTPTTRPILEAHNKELEEYHALEEAKYIQKVEREKVEREKLRVEVLKTLPASVEEVIARLKSIDLSQLDYGSVNNLSNGLSNVNRILQDAFEALEKPVDKK